MLTAARNLIERKTNVWLFQLRDVEPGEVVLNQRRVFILPTRAGLAFAALVLVLLIGSTNYNLGLGFALTFALLSCGLIDMIFTFRNLAQLRLRPGRARSVFAGEEAQFELHVVNDSKLDRYALSVEFLRPGASRHALDAAAGASADVTLSTLSVERGYLAPPRVRLLTRFPLGLFRAWSYWQPDLKALVYPFPETAAPPLPLIAAGSGEGHGHSGQEDFAGIRSYQAGDAMRHLAWRQIARLDPALGGQLVTKHFDGGAREQLVLDFNALPATIDVELRLSRMTRWVLEAEQRALPYAFRLGAISFDTELGAAHRAACLRALALYGMKESV
jgi:uncharacterized protein (DUF58 family)